MTRAFNDYERVVGFGPFEVSLPTKVEHYSKMNSIKRVLKEWNSFLAPDSNCIKAEVKSNWNIFIIPS